MNSEATSPLKGTEDDSSPPSAPILIGNLQTQNNPQSFNHQYNPPISSLPGLTTPPSTNATFSLVLAIVSLVFGGILLAVPSLLMANSARKITDQYPGHPDATTAKNAQKISWVVIVISVLFFALFLVLFASI
tara:strand:- start:22 stop:420 length:399 start_codon:yes stop_codon:yes gene_type:complete